MREDLQDVVIAYKQRRKRRLDQKAVDRYKERRHNRIWVRKDGEHGNTKLPFGLCDREGIDTGKDWTPRDAWSALEDKGIHPNEVYKGMQEKTKKERRAKKIRKALISKPNEAVFFSGCSTEDADGNYKSPSQVAREFADSNEGVTMETLFARNEVDMPDFDRDDLDSLKSWEEASSAYAEQASGDVRVIARPPLREHNIFENVELPKLKANPNVTSVTMINPDTNERTEIFRR